MIILDSTDMVIHLTTKNRVLQDNKEVKINRILSEIKLAN